MTISVWSYFARCLNGPEFNGLDYAIINDVRAYLRDRAQTEDPVIMVRESVSSETPGSASLWQEMQSETTLVEIIARLAEELFLRRKYGTIIALVSGIEQGFRKISSTPQLTLALVYSGAKAKMGDPSTAQILLNSVLPSVETYAGKKELVLLYMAQGYSFASQVSLDEAVDSLKRALNVAIESQFGLFSGTILQEIGIIQKRMGDFSASAESYYRALQHYSEAGDDYCVVDLLAGLGSLYVSWSRFSEASDCFHQALSIVGSLSGFEAQSMRCVLLSNIAVVYDRLKQHTESLEYHLRALELAKTYGLDHQLPYTYFGIGAAYGNLHQLDQTFKYFKIAGDLFQQNQDTTMVIAIESEVAKLFNALGLSILAAEICTTTLALQERFRLYTDRAETLMSRAYAYVSLRRYEEAVSDFEEAFSFFHAKSVLYGAGLSKRGLGIVYRDTNRFDLAESSIREAIELFELSGSSVDVALSRAELAEIYLQESYTHYSPERAALLIEGVREELDRVEGMKRALTVLPVVEKLSILQEDWHNAFELLVERIEYQKKSRVEETRTEQMRLHVEKLIAQRDVELHAKSKNQGELIAKLLPEECAAQLLKGEIRIANTYPNVSLLLLDVVGFTITAAHSEPSALVRSLDYFFRSLDSICQLHGIEKVKTVGDGYLACCGISDSYSDQADRIAACALDMLSFARATSEGRHEEHSVLSAVFPHGLSVRIGLHSGQLIGGVIGVDRLQFDILGDAIETVKSLEQTAEPNTIVCSQNFRDNCSRDWGIRVMRV